MVTIFDRVREGLLTDPGVSRSGNIRVTSENAYFWENAIVDFARSHGVEELRFERRLLALEGNFFDEDFIRPEEIDLRPDDTIRFVSIAEGAKISRHIIIYINKDELNDVFDMVDKWIYSLQ